jgi:hypothetical protein
MSIRSQATCLALALVLYCIPESSLQQPAPSPAVPPPNEEAGRPAGWREVMASELEPETFYCPIAYGHAPFINVFAIHRSGEPEVARPRVDAAEPAGTSHFLFAGQQTAEVRAAGADVIA